MHLEIEIHFGSQIHFGVKIHLEVEIHFGSQNTFLVKTSFCGEWNLEFGSNTTDKFEISRGEAE